jgi:hypothetical protein
MLNPSGSFTVDKSIFLLNILGIGGFIFPQ